MRKKRILFLSGLVLTAFLAAALLCSCSGSQHLCPAYGNQYKVEPLPY
ncbi:MAG: hypothetical protein NC048_03020 [Bacteroides sp.]|nr:hypothetical protein [Ruminococcus flavefaciens]MCM1554448.1 hypothetical protein [Bacteroides sp.]